MADEQRYFVANLARAVPGRIYTSKGGEALGVVTVRMVVQDLTENQLPGPPTELRLALSGRGAECLSESLELAAQSLRRQKDLGDH